MSTEGSGWLLIALALVLRRWSRRCWHRAAWRWLVEAGRLSTASQEERAAPDLPDHRYRVLLALSRSSASCFKVIFGPPFGRALVSLPTLVERNTILTIGDTGITNIQIIVIVGALVMMLALDSFVNQSRFGRGVRAVAQDPDTAALMGVNKDRVIMLVFVLGGAMAGVAAVLTSMRFGITKFDIGFLIGIKAFTAAVLGGIGNLRGALLGGLLLGIVEIYSSSLFSSNWKDVIAFVVLVVRADVPARPVCWVSRWGRHAHDASAQTMVEAHERSSGALADALPHWCRVVGMLGFVAVPLPAVPEHAAVRLHPHRT